MSRLLAPTWLVVAPFLGAACLGDVPPFQGGGGEATSSTGDSTTPASGSTSGSVGSASTSSGGGQGGDGGRGGQGGDGGRGGAPPAGSTSTGSSVCGLDEMPSTCGEAYVALDCAGLGTEEDCSAVTCPVGDCAFPVATFFESLPEGYCIETSSGDPPCLVCDGAGPAVALVTTKLNGPLPIAAFSPGMPAVAYLVARGAGRFRLGWSAGEDDTGTSDVYALTLEHTTYEVPVTTQASFELRVIEDSGSLDNGPLWIEIDCAYTLDRASSAAEAR